MAVATAFEEAFPKMSWCVRDIAAIVRRVAFTLCELLIWADFGREKSGNREMLLLRDVSLVMAKLNSSVGPKTENVVLNERRSHAILAVGGDCWCTRIDL